MSADGIRTMQAVTATWDAQRLAWAVHLLGKVIYALDEDDARRRASAFVGTYQPVRFVGPVVYPKEATGG